MIPQSRFGNLAAHAHEILRGWILDGTLLPGTRLSVRELAGKLDVSNGPIRDALIELRSQGLVQGGHGPEWSVADITPERVDDLSIVREALEVESARRCALAIKPVGVQKLRMMALDVDRRIELKLENDPFTIELDGRFHYAIAEIAGSRTLCEEIERWRVVMTWACMYMKNFTQRAQSHVKVVDAIATGDPRIAEEEMREHVRHPWKDLKVLFDAKITTNDAPKQPQRRGRPSGTAKA